MRFDSDLRSQITRNLAAFEPGPFAPAPNNPANIRHAAVGLVVLDDGKGDAALLLTRRTSHLSSHKGQYALPGGRMDPGETAIQAALREAHEEVGLAIPENAVLGRLDDYATRSGYVMTPIVAWAEDDSTLRANPREVAVIYRIHLGELVRNNQPHFITIPESDRPVIRYPLFDTLIHAPTAALIYQFVEVALLGRNTRVAHLEQPVFAWK